MFNYLIAYIYIFISMTFSCSIILAQKFQCNSHICILHVQFRWPFLLIWHHFEAITNLTAELLANMMRSPSDPKKKKKIGNTGEKLLHEGVESASSHRQT